MKATLQPFSPRTLATLTDSRAPLSPVALVLVSGSTYRLYDGLGRVSDKAPLQIREIGGRRLSPSQRRNLAPADCPTPSQLVPPDSGLRPELSVMASPTLRVSGGARDGRVLLSSEYALGAFDSLGNLPLTVAEYPASVAEVRATEDATGLEVVVPADRWSYSAGSLALQRWPESVAPVLDDGTVLSAVEHTNLLPSPAIWSVGSGLTVSTSGSRVNLTETATTGWHYRQASLPTAADAVTVALTLYPRGRLRWTIEVVTRSGATRVVYLVLSGSGTSSASPGVLYSLTQRADGGWRVVLSTTLDAGASAPGLALAGRADPFVGSYTGDPSCGVDVAEWTAEPVAAPTLSLTGRIIATTTTPLTIKDFTWTRSTGTLTLTQGHAGNVRNGANGPYFQRVNDTTFQLPAEFPKAGTRVTADGVECSGSGASWTVPPLNTGQLVWADAPEGCVLTQTGPRAYTLTRPEAAPSSLLGSSALRWTADTRTGKSAWIAAPQIVAGTVYKACLDVELDPGAALPNYDSRGPSYATDGIRIWISGVNPVFGQGEWIHLGENRYRLQVTGLSVQTPTGKIGIVRGGYSVLLKFSRWQCEVQEPAPVVHYAHIPGGWSGPDYVQAGSDVTLSHPIDSAPEAVWA